MPGNTHQVQPDDASPSHIVRGLCRELGFAMVGFTKPTPTARPDDFTQWLARGKHGEMAYLEQHRDIRTEPQRLLADAQAVICVADRYAVGNRDRRTPGRGRIARYTRGDDYHRVMKKRLHILCDELCSRFPAHTFRACVDTAPILERELAAQAGLGAIGKHTLLIQPGVGSWMLLGEVFTTLPMDTHQHVSADVCQSCTRCIDACPTDAITPYQLDATRCISYLTIEHRSEIDEQFHDAIGDWIFGCDICQEVCPHCQPTTRSRRASIHEGYTPHHDSFDLLDVLGWSEQDRRDAFIRSAMKRAKLNMMKRNAIIAATNSLLKRNAPRLRAAIEHLACDANEDELVRSTARLCLARLGGHGV